MAYKIHYRSENYKILPISKLRLFVLTLAFFALFLVLTMLFIPEQIQLLHYIIFGQDNVEALLQDLREGEPILEAVSAFCQGIINEK